MVRVILVEDNNEFRQAVRTILLSRYPYIQLIEAQSGDEVMRMIDPVPADLIFMDIHLPGRDGLSLTREIKARHPGTIIIVLSSHDLPEYRESAYRNGADYFVSKDSPAADLFDLIEWITRNGIKS